MVLVLKKYGGLGLGLGLETQSLGLGLDKIVLFTSLVRGGERGGEGNGGEEVSGDNERSVFSIDSPGFSWNMGTK